MIRSQHNFSKIQIQGDETKLRKLELGMPQRHENQNNPGRTLFTYTNWIVTIQPDQLTHFKISRIHSIPKGFLLCPDGRLQRSYWVNIVEKGPERSFYTK